MQLPVTELAATVVNITSVPSKLDAQSLFLLSGSILTKLTEIALYNFSVSSLSIYMNVLYMVLQYVTPISQVQQNYFEVIDNILGANRSSLVESQNMFNTSSRFVCMVYTTIAIITNMVILSAVLCMLRELSVPSLP